MTKRRESSSLRPGTEYLYVLQFDNGVVKVGRTSDPQARSERHERDCGRFGLAVVHRWVSGKWENAQWAERQLVAVLARIGERTRAGREYFHKVPFSIACQQARQVYSTTCPSCGNGVVPATNAYDSRRRERRVNARRLPRLRLPAALQGNHHRPAARPGYVGAGQIPAAEG